VGGYREPSSLNSKNRLAESENHVMFVLVADWPGVALSTPLSLRKGRRSPLAPTAMLNSNFGSKQLISYNVSLRKSEQVQ
jgi:hypothetical protein